MPSTATPIFVESTLGRMLMGGTSGNSGSLMRWKLFFPENKKRLDNYALNPQSACNVSPSYLQASGGWDTANPPHATSTGGQMNINYSVALTIYLGINGTTDGYLGSFLVTGWNAGHGLVEGADFEFTADQQGALTFFPSS